MKFRPMLGSNEPLDLDKLTYPIMGEYKYDGIRGEIMDGKLLSRELKPIPNIKVQEFEAIQKLKAISQNRVFDVELYIEGIPFNEHSMFILTKDYNRTHVNKVKRKLKSGELTKPYHFYTRLPKKEFKIVVFDMLIEGKEMMPYKKRNEYANYICNSLECENIIRPKSRLLLNRRDVERMFNTAILEGFEGIVLKKLGGIYKQGRSTLKEELFLKLKPIETLVARITGVTERTKNITDSHTSLLGYSAKKQVKENIVTTGIAATFIVDYEGKELKVTLNGSEEYRREIWSNRESYIGKKIEFKGMLYGAKDLPRHPTLIKIC